MNNSLKLLLTTNAIFVFADNLFGPLYAVYLQHLNNSIAIVSGTWSIKLFTTTITNLVLAKLGDHVREHEYLLITGYFIRAVSWFAFAFASDLSHIIFIQVLLGIGEAVGSTGFDTIFAEHLDRSRHIHDYATWQSISNIVAAVATILGGLVVTTFGFTPLFYIMGLIAFICGIFTLLLPRKLF